MTFNFLKGPLNQHIELTRLATAITAASAIGLTSVHLWRDHAFDIAQFGIGMLAIIGGGAGGSAIKDTAAAKAANAAQGAGQ